MSFESKSGSAATTAFSTSLLVRVSSAPFWPSEMKFDIAFVSVPVEPGLPTSAEGNDTFTWPDPEFGSLS